MVKRIDSSVDRTSLHITENQSTRITTARSTTNVTTAIRISTVEREIQIMREVYERIYGRPASKGAILSLNLRKSSIIIPVMKRVTIPPNKFELLTSDRERMAFLRNRKVISIS